MKTISCSLIRRLLFDKSGQSMVWVAVSLTALLGMAGLTLDVGHAYVVRSQLQSVVNACSLTGVSGLTSGVSPSQTVVSNCENSDNQPSWGIGTAPNTTNAPNATVKCLNAMMPTGQSCSGSNILNSVQVTEIVNVPTYFMRIFGYKSLPVSATATATPAEARPWIVEFVLDTTPSMIDSDSNCTGASTAEACALIGIQGMLSKLNACPPGTTNCTAANANIRFGLMTFPNIKTTEAEYNFNSNAGAGSNCNNGTVHFQPYSTPVIPTAQYTTVNNNTYPTEVTPSSYSSITYTNAVINWQSNPTQTTSTLNLTYQPTNGASDMDTNGFYINYYKATDTSGLNPSSTLVQAIGRSADSVNPCLQIPQSPYPVGFNGGGTYFAGALYAAETAVLAEQTAYPKVNNLYTQTAIIFLSDGQANTLSTMFPPAGTPVTAGGVRDSNGLSVMNGILQGNGSGQHPYGPPTTSPANTLLGTYPSGFDACQQAVAAAQYATEQGTRVYTVAYGAENGGCLFYANGTSGTAGGGSGSDVNPLISFTTSLAYPFSSITDVVPCNTIMDMASDMQYFYSDANQEKTGQGNGTNAVDTSCTSPDHSSVTSLNDIFLNIYGSLTAARLIPNGTT